MRKRGERERGERERRRGEREGRERGDMVARKLGYTQLYTKGGGGK